MEFQEGEKVFSKVSPHDAFWEDGKLSPLYVKPFPVLEKIRATTYHLELPSNLEGIHLFFHVLILCKYVLNENHVMP